MNRFCPNGHEVSDTTKYCPVCGMKTETKMFCPKCGKERKGEERFCSKCGFSFSRNHEFNLSPETIKEGRNSKTPVTLIIAVIIALAAGGFLLSHVEWLEKGLKNSKHNIIESSQIERRENDDTQTKTKEWEYEERKREEARKREEYKESKRAQCVQATESCRNRILEIEEGFAHTCATYSILKGDANPYSDAQMRMTVTTNCSRLVKEGERLYDECYKTWRTNGFHKEAQEIAKEKKDFSNRMYAMEHEILY